MELVHSCDVKEVSCADRAHSSSVNDECESVSLGIETLGVISNVNACAGAHGFLQ